MKILDEIHNILYLLFYNARHTKSDFLAFFLCVQKQRLSVHHLYQIFSGANRGQGHGKDAEHYDFAFVYNY